MNPETVINMLKKTQPALCAALERAATGHIEPVVNRQGEAVPRVEVDGKKIFVHSKYAPYKEAERFLAEVKSFDYDLFIVCGFGYGYHLELLLEKIRPNTVVLVLEKDAGMLRSALEQRDLRTLLEDERMRILLAPDDDAIALALQGKSSHQVTFIMHRGSFQLDLGYYQNLLQLAKSYLSTKVVNIATLAKFEKTWSANIARNINVFLDSPGAAIFYEQCKGIPALVVAAGPSLSKSLDFIKAQRKSMLIIAVDTAYALLRRHGIVPHFCVCVDPQVINARYFENDRAGRTIMVADPTVHPSVFHLFKGRKVVTSVPLDMMKWLEECSSVKGEMTHGGSVSTNAYDFAVRIGASPIVMVGQDLAFSGGLAHARGSYLDEQLHLKTNRMMNIQMYNRAQLTALPKIMVKSIQGGQVHTNQKMMIFLSWFEKRRNPDLLNASLDGALINQVAHTELSALSFPERSHLWDTLNSLFLGAAARQAVTISARSRVAAKVELLANEMGAMSERLAKALALSEELCTLIEGEKKDQGRVSHILKRLAEIDAYIESRTSVKDMIGITVQRVIHTITEGYDLDEHDACASEELQVARKSLYLYRGLKEGADFNSKLLSRMKVLLARG